MLPSLLYIQNIQHNIKCIFPLKAPRPSIWVQTHKTCFLIKCCLNFLSFLPFFSFLHIKMFKNIFPSIFGVHGTKMLVKIYNKFNLSQQYQNTEFSLTHPSRLKSWYKKTFFVAKDLQIKLIFCSLPLFVCWRVKAAFIPTLKHNLNWQCLCFCLKATSKVWHNTAHHKKHN